MVQRREEGGVTREDLKRVVAANTPDSHHEWAHELAIVLQKMDVEAVTTFLPPTDPMRQVYRRVIRWAKAQTTEEVEKALKEVGL
jgi:hypothetical protein